jgi:shikimate kinase
MGAGKTRAGRLVADALGWPFHDADRMIEKAAQMTIPEIFQNEGEAAFRDRETDVVSALAATDPPLVAAMGGGVVEREENRVILERDFFVVWIQVDPREAAGRLAGKKGRPLLDTEDPVGALQALAARRSPHYLKIADLKLATDAGTRPEDQRARVLDALAQLG